MEGYRSFIEQKIKVAAPAGLPCDLMDIQTHLRDGRRLKDHQRHIIQWAVRGGRRATFASFGLGKSVIQLETGRVILAKAGGAGLIVGPLGARGDLQRDAANLGLDVPFVRSMDEIRGEGLHLTNFDTVRDRKIDLSAFTFASLDEAAVLRDYGSETFQSFCPMFEAVPYRYVATAMPSPNRYKELIHYAHFLGIMDSGQALTRFFQRNSEKAGDLTLYPHKEQEFWLWMHSWAVFLQKPSDLGFSDEGYELPPLTVRYHKVAANLAAAGVEANGQARMLKDAALGIVEAAREKRDTIAVRVAKAQEIAVAAPEDHFIFWHDLEDERRAIEDAIPGVVSIYGGQDLDLRDSLTADFTEGRLARIAAKPVMLGAGPNFQYHCHRAVFVGITHKFHDFLQALHRIWRFLQGHAVEIDVIYAETEAEVLRVLLAKWDQHNAMMERMSEIIRQYGLNHDAAASTLKRSIGVMREELRGEDWTAVNNDCVDEVRRMPENFIDLIVTSIPFGNHYEYSERYEDFGHTDDHEHFFRQMDYLTPELLRVLRPGRIAAIHVKDRIQFASVTGMTRPTVEPFHADCIQHFKRHGFGYMGLRFISTDVVRENNATYRLTYKELRKDGTKMGSGSPEFVLLFFKLPTDRSNGYADIPVTKDASEYSLARWQVDAHALWRSSGNRPLTPAELASMSPHDLAKTFTAWSVQDIYDYEQHVAIGEALAQREALPKTFMALAPGSCREDAWTDITRMQTLNGEQSKRGLENHICPLQFDVVDRLIRLYSNKSDLVLDPFGGLMTVPMRALKLDRRGYGVELNAKYFRDGVRYLRETEAQRAVPDLFDLLSVEAAE